MSAIGQGVDSVELCHDIFEFIPGHSVPQQYVIQVHRILQKGVHSAKVEIKGVFSQRSLGAWVGPRRCELSAVKGDVGSVREQCWSLEGTTSVAFRGGLRYITLNAVLSTRGQLRWTPRWKDFVHDGLSG